MTQEEINKKCLEYMEQISNMGHNRELDYITADYMGADAVDYTEVDLERLKFGYEAFWFADEQTPGFENLVLDRHYDKNNSK